MIEDLMKKGKKLFYKYLSEIGINAFPSLNERPSMAFVEKSAKGKELVGAEIGTYIGHNARIMLKRMHIKHLYLIDPYDNQVLEDIGFDKIDSEYKKAQQRVKPWKDKVTFVLKYSDKAVNDVPDNLDFVYIDGNHDYDFVKKDIELYYPKVRKGGVVAGHDFVASEQGVIRAAIEFADAHKHTLMSEEDDWWFVKN
jgi:predicted O-methyltransferase YrrM